MKQIIVFINHEKFYFLLNKQPALDRKYSKKTKDGDIINLQGGKHIFYVRDKFFKQGRYNDEEAQAATYLLVPDNLKFEYTPNPQLNFKVLYHSETRKFYSHQYKRLKVLPNFKGSIEQPEEEFLPKDESTPEKEYTIYGIIAEQIKIGENIDINQVWKKIPEFNFTLEARLNLLHNCLTPSGAANSEKLFLDDKQMTIVESLAKQKDNFSEDYLRNLTELRRLLLDS